jgi:hypothetical protein
MSGDHFRAIRKPGKDRLELFLGFHFGEPNELHKRSLGRTGKGATPALETFENTEL